MGADAYDEALKRLRAHWHLLQTRYGFDGWKRTWISPFLGVRETHRLVGRYVLKEQDLTAGLAHQEHEDIVALADHSIDFHGARPSREVPNGPYGIPFRCLIATRIGQLAGGLSRSQLLLHRRLFLPPFPHPETWPKETWPKAKRQSLTASYWNSLKS